MRKSVLVAAVLVVAAACAMPAQAKVGNRRWSRGNGPNARLATRISGTIERIETVPSGATDQTQISVMTLRVNGSAVPVELGPEWYVQGSPVKLSPGDTVTVIGSQQWRRDQWEVVARTVSVGTQRMALRDPQGVPLWFTANRKAGVAASYGAANGGSRSTVRRTVTVTRTRRVVRHRVHRMARMGGASRYRHTRHMMRTMRHHRMARMGAATRYHRMVGVMRHRRLARQQSTVYRHSSSRTTTRYHTSAMTGGASIAPAVQTTPPLKASNIRYGAVGQGYVDGSGRSILSRSMSNPNPGPISGTTSGGAAGQEDTPGTSGNPMGGIGTSESSTVTGGPVAPLVEPSPADQSGANRSIWPVTPGRSSSVNTVGGSTVGMGAGATGAARSDIGSGSGSARRVVGSTGR